ncbi:hypothetical protein AUEXF2481DRAFT_26849 [Aureobasidium subglaciale EXF-2481]|uniref:Uncharacterized protein n=1 Tax=Aureobasidium subglaciale (strain EXF-2481) TaxID=1043005 RepID=A0A074YWC0_AURSE|nr:uncharacterized protein AUEXF2481DRAFT_26849 [Aureobasidium subglaciale EXF-2481]KEQ98472.1 hypothetical protein AUEXF2481DRAFT_26849 [Aureobasidium subglaciale EXF-2481]
MPGTSSPSDTYEQFKRALRNLFRRRKFSTNVAAVVKPQAPTRPPRPRSASAVAAPEVFTSPDVPSWPIFGQMQYGGGLYCAPVELPGSLAPMLQHRSKSDIGQPIYHSDLFSELDATSVRRLSIIGSEAGEDEDLEEAYMKLQAELKEQQTQNEVSQTEEEHITPEEITEIAYEQSKAIERPSTETPAQSEPEHNHDDALFEDAEEHLAPKQETEELVEPANIALPESSDSGMFDRRNRLSNAQLISADLEEEDDHLVTLEAEELAKNDPANGDKEFHDDSSSLYTSDGSENDVDSTTDAATVSTPRTASLIRAEMTEYFEEKIPVLSEPPQAIFVIPAPGMAATSGPLEEFSW